MVATRLVVAIWTCIALTWQGVEAWDESELEVFDAIEDVNQNFYEFLGVSQEASSAEIRKAYRQLSLVLHPDKNDAADADAKFRNLVAIYEVLKDPAKREVYNRVLVEGLPDWRTPVFYYRRMRKMGLAEGLAYLSIIVTVCQYFILWAAYFERKLNMKEAFTSQNKKLMKKSKKSGQKLEDINAVLETHEENLIGPKPSCFDTLPFQLFRSLKYIIFAVPTLPSTVKDMYMEAKEKKLEAERKKREEEEERERREKEKEERKEQRKKRKQVDQYQDRTGEDNITKDSSDEDGPPPAVDAFSQPANALQIWTDQDLAKLAKLMKKYPAGTPERWEKIADIMERLPWEVTKMARKVKDVGFQIPISRSAQGVTGLECKRLVSDDRMEYNAKEGSEAETDEEADSDDESSTDLDDENYGVYSVATKEDYVIPEIKVKKKTKGGKREEGGDDGQALEDGSKAEDVSKSGETWTQQQQKALESALTKYPKGTTERWDRIASKVPGKSKEQCMARFKELAEQVKKKRENAASQ